MPTFPEQANCSPAGLTASEPPEMAAIYDLLFIGGTARPYT